jgi:hypothetical protein
VCELRGGAAASGAFLLVPHLTHPRNASDRPGVKVSIGQTVFIVTMMQPTVRPLVSGRRSCSSQLEASTVRHVSSTPIEVPRRTGLRFPSYDVADRCLAAWFIAWFTVYVRGGGMAWHFFVQGQQALSDLDDPVRGGIHLYAALPQLQIGPLALLAAWVFSPFGIQVSLFIAQVFGAAAGVTILLLARSITEQLRPDLTRQQITRRTRLAAVFFTPVWLYLAVGSVHLDDVLALLFGVLATAAAVKHRPLLAGSFVGLAVDAKPWALPFAAVLLVLVRPAARALALAALVTTVAATWLPFLLFDPHTLNAIQFTIPNTPRTALRVLGIDTPRTPSWDRPAQALLGLLLAATAVYRGRSTAVILMAVAARTVLDPGTNLYYSAGLVVGAALWDITGSRHRWPWWTALAALTQFLARYAPLPPSTYGRLSLSFFLACMLLLSSGHTPPTPRSSSRR